MNQKSIPYSVLYVDLDGSLLKTDSLWEQIALILRSPWLLFGALLSLLKGKLSFKFYCLHHAGIPSVSLLPFNKEVLNIIQKHVDADIPVILATAALQDIALEVQRNVLGISEVIASTSTVNLKGEYKAQAIQEHAEGRAFAYIGNDHADLPVWKHAKGVFYVGAKPSITSILLREHDHVTIIDDEIKGNLSSYLHQIRLYQWVKNSLVFLPAFLAHTLSIQYAGLLFITFVVFGLMASSVYVLNDILDLQSDRIHPNKKKRPLASCEISIPHGLMLYCGLLISSICIGLALLPIDVMYVLFAYAIATTFYSVFGKKIAILDVMLLAGLYTMRLIAGAETVNVPLSEWFMGFSMFFFISLAFVKRYSEIISRKESITSIPGRGYSIGDELVLLTAGLASAMLSILVLALYINSDAVVQLYAHPHYLWILCPVILTWLLQLWFIAHRGKMHDDPIITMARTPMTYIVLFIIVFTVIAATI